MFSIVHNAAEAWRGVRDETHGAYVAVILQILWSIDQMNTDRAGRLIEAVLRSPDRAQSGLEPER